MDPEEAARRIEEERRRQQEEDERRKMMEPVLMGVAVERAMHLPSVPGVNRLISLLPIEHFVCCNTIFVYLLAGEFHSCQLFFVQPPNHLKLPSQFPLCFIIFDAG